MLKVPKMLSYLQLMDVQTMWMKERRLRLVMSACVSERERVKGRVYICVFVSERGSEIGSESEKVMPLEWGRKLAE